MVKVHSNFRVSGKLLYKLALRINQTNLKARSASTETNLVHMADMAREDCGPDPSQAGRRMAPKPHKDLGTRAASHNSSATPVPSTPQREAF